ncbi:MAG: P-II family nitrogen regulator [Dyella sp.]|uniref:P-II family nitrogen regulator n=1 Tax=Dyella sp. TaxID=1869338 RepID=UPI003F814485
MKEVKAYVHRGRVADIVHGLEQAGFVHLSVNDVKGLLSASSERERTYSIELGERVTNQVRLEVFCEDAEAAEAVALIRRHGRTGQRIGGWVYVSAVEEAWPIDGG